MITMNGEMMNEDDDWNVILYPHQIYTEPLSSISIFSYPSYPMLSLFNQSSP